MSYDHVIDSYAWIEYFLGSRRGKDAKKYVEGEGTATPTIVIAELSRKLMNEIACGRETADGRLARLGFVRASSSIVDLTEEIATVSGEIDVERKRNVPRWGLADSIILATARTTNAKVVTGDEHFRDLSKEVVFLS